MKGIPGRREDEGKEDEESEGKSAESEEGKGGGRHQRRRDGIKNDPQ